MPSPSAPRFAIVMTVRNNVRYVREAMASILPECGDDGEVVIVDAESTDGTTDYLRELESRGQIRLLVRPCTRGRGRHLGVLASSAPIVLTQVDADVRYRKGSIREGVDHFEQEGRHQMTVVYGIDDPNPGTVKMFVWDREYYLATGGYEDRNLHDDMKLIRKVLSVRGAHRFVVPYLGEDLQVQGSGPRVRPTGWGLAKEFVRIGRVFHADGWGFVVYVRFLWITRRTVGGFLAAVPLSVIAFLLRPTPLAPEVLDRMTPTRET